METASLVFLRRLYSKKRPESFLEIKTRYVRKRFRERRLLESDVCWRGVFFKNLYFYLTLNRNMYVIQLLLQAQCSKIQGVLDIILEELTGIKDEYTHFDVKSKQSLLCKESRLVKS